MVETTAWGHPNFRAGGVTFCAFETIGGRPSVAFRLPPHEAERRLATPSGFATPYGRGRWTSLWVDETVDWPAIAALIEQSYRAVAKQRLLALLDAPASRKGLTRY